MPKNRQISGIQILWPLLAKPDPDPSSNVLILVRTAASVIGFDFFLDTRATPLRFVHFHAPSWIALLVPLRVFGGSQAIFNCHNPFDQFPAAVFVVGVVGQNGLAHVVGGEEASPHTVALQEVDGNVDVLVDEGQVGEDAVEQRHGFGSSSLPVQPVDVDEGFVDGGGIEPVDASIQSLDHFRQGPAAGDVQPAFGGFQHPS